MAKPMTIEQVADLLRHSSTKGMVSAEWAYELCKSVAAGNDELVEAAKVVVESVYAPQLVDKVKLNRLREALKSEGSDD